MPFFGVPIRNGLPIGLGSVAGFGVQQFDPSQLFEGGTVAGAWYDPSDLSTMFTTSAGTTPVAMPGLGAAVSVGLMLDKSQGLVLGSELVTNGDFSSGTTGWSGVNATLAVVNGAVQITADGVGQARASQTVSGLTAGRWYEVRAKIWQGTGALNVDILVTGIAQSTAVSTTTPTDAVVRFVAAGATQAIRVGSNSAAVAGTTYFADNVSVRELPGNHAISFNNTTARPELRARVNLLTYSEEFDNGAWTKDSCTITANATTAPNGTLTADKVVSAAATAQTGVGQSATTTATQFTQSWFVKQAEVRFVQLLWNAGASTEYANFDLQTGVVTQTTASVTPTISAAANGFYRITLTSTSASGTVTAYCWAISSGTTGRAGTYPGNGTDGWFVWGADLRPANIGANVPAYQRIADALTYDTSGFPLYLYFDGTDDSMYTPANLNLSGTDKVAVFAGVRKLSDATAGMLVELSANYNTNIGSFLVVAPDAAANYSFGLNGTFNTALIATTFASPITNVLSCGLDIAEPTRATEIKPRVNASIPTLTGVGNASAGTGNFGTYPLFIGSRNNASVRLNAQLYSLIIAGSAVSAGNISATEQWVAGKTGIQI